MNRPKKKIGTKKHAATVPSNQRWENIATLPELRQKIAERVALAAVGMVETTIAQAEEGNYSAMKYLFEIAGLFPATDPEAAPTDDSLAGVLLQRLGLEEKTESSESATAGATGEDAVK